ncbi:MAG: ImmA/IrrE family metallo-endopeptidase [bacterium]
MYIKKIVKRIINTHETNNPWKLAKALNILVTLEPLGKNIKGFFTTVLRIKQIVINSDLDEISQNIVLAHELGHAVLHSNQILGYLKEHTLFPTGRYEKEANKFAAELLISDDHEEFFKEYGYIRVAECLGVPAELAEYKFVKQEHLC